MNTNGILLSITVITATLSAFGQSTLVYDQQSSTDETHGPGSTAPISQSAPLGQSFTPSLSSVGFVTLFNEDLIGHTGVGAEIYVNLHSGSITGPILGTTETLDFPATLSGNPDQVFHGFETFDFSTPVSVTPDTQYYFEVVEASGGDPWSIGAEEAYGYTGGNAIDFGIPSPGLDDWFREGIVETPEPSVWALLVFGCGALAFRRRRTERASWESGATILR